MLIQAFLLVLEVVFGFFSTLLLARFVMQWLRVSFRNQLGAFVIAATDWLVKPARRMIPSALGFDLPCLVLAWLVQVLLVLISLWLKGFSFSTAPFSAPAVLLLLGFIETVKLALSMLSVLVIFSAIISWVSPHAPIAPMLYSLTRPFLRPLQRFIPPIANVDLSPLALLLLLQVLLMLIGAWRANVVVLLV